MDAVALTAEAVSIVTAFLQKAAADSADKLASAVGDKMVSQGGALWKLIRQKFQGETQTKELAERVEVAPDDPRTQGALEFALLSLVQRDREFLIALEAHVQNVARLADAQRTEVSDSGFVVLDGKVVMRGNHVAGRDLHINTGNRESLPGPVAGESLGEDS